MIMGPYPAMFPGFGLQASFRVGLNGMEFSRFDNPSHAAILYGDLGLRMQHSGGPRVHSGGHGWLQG